MRDGEGEDEEEVVGEWGVQDLGLFTLNEQREILNEKTPAKLMTGV